MRGCADYLRGRSWLVGAGSFMSVAGADLMCLECKRVVRGRLLGAWGGGHGPTEEAGFQTCRVGGTTSLALGCIRSAS